MTRQTANLRLAVLCKKALVRRSLFSLYSKFWVLTKNVILSDRKP